MFFSAIDTSELIFWNGKGKKRSLLVVHFSLLFKVCPELIVLWHYFIVFFWRMTVLNETDIHLYKAILETIKLNESDLQRKAAFLCKWFCNALFVEKVFSKKTSSQWCFYNHKKPYCNKQETNWRKKCFFHFKIYPNATSMPVRK